VDAPSSVLAGRPDLARGLREGAIEERDAVHGMLRIRHGEDLRELLGARIGLSSGACVPWIHSPLS
jgi:hypothetical protein